jgi:hypothetical protein
LGAEGARQYGDAIVGAGLGKDRLEVVLDRVLGQRHPARHRSSVAAGGEQANKLVFADAEAEGAAKELEPLRGGGLLVRR